MRQMEFLVLALLFLGLASWLPAEVVSSGTSHMEVRTILQVAVEPGPLYQALVQDVNRWWESSHTFSGDSANLTIEPVIGGCFCERFPGGGGVQHLEIVNVRPGELLRGRGGLGPLQAMAVEGSLTVQLSKGSPSGSTLEMTYVVSGYSAGGLDSLAEVVDSVLATQFRRLKLYAETGKPE